MVIKNKPVPCRNCLVYPSCRNRTAIECKLLFDWMNTRNRESMLELNESFPKWATVNSGSTKRNWMYVNSRE